jgi:hypothetical protein
MGAGRLTAENGGFPARAVAMRQDTRERRSRTLKDRLIRQHYHYHFRGKSGTKTDFFDYLMRTTHKCAALCYTKRLLSNLLKPVTEQPFKNGY